MLLEREHQLDVLGDRLRLARAGHGSLVLVGGEAGAGKTSLVGEFIAPLGDSAVVGACDPLSTPRPLSPLRDFFDVGDGAAIDLFRDVLGRFGRSTSAAATVMVIEDVHWADEVTLDFIRYVGRRVVDSALLVVCTYRDDELGVGHPLRTVLGQLARIPSTVRVRVPMLSLEAVRTLTASTTLDPRSLHGLTGGNAFFVTEVIAAGGTPPESVQDAVLARLGGLSSGVCGVIEAVSISPRSIDIRRALAFGNQVADIDRAVDSGVILADGEQLRFRHELARSSVEEAIPPARRHQLHREMLSLLLDEIDPDGARVAHHAIKANAPELIAEYAPVAARDASGRGATREAVALFRAALDHPDQLRPEVAASIRVEFGAELIALDQPTEALDQLEVARRYFFSVGDDLRQVDALGQIGRATYALGGTDGAMSCARESVELAERHGPSERLVLALNDVAGSLMLARRAHDGRPYAERAARMADELGLDRPLAVVEFTQACLELVGGDAELGLEQMAASVDRLAELSVTDHVTGLVNLGSGAGEVRRYETALDALVAAEELGVANDLDASVAYARAWLARIAFEQGRWDDSVAYAALVDATTTNRGGYALLTARGVLGRIRVRRGDPGGVAMLRETLAGFRGHELQYRWPPVAGLAEHYWLSGQREELVEILSGPYQESLDTDSGWAQGELSYWMWKAGEIHSPAPHAALPFASQILAQPDRAVDLWERIGSPYEAALARSEGTPVMVIDALSILDVLGAMPLADRLRAELRAAGIDGIPPRPSPSTQAHPLGLTMRQAEVLDLIVDDLSNGEIAERLFISKKTVEHHISAIFAKLGVETRTQAIRAAR